MSQYAATRLPAARLDDLVTTESGDELLVYDTKTHVIHHLNPMATTIWRLLDGRQTLDSLERAASADLGMEVHREGVESALTSLDRLGLLNGHVAFESAPANPSRRRFLRKAAAAGVAVPVIASITAPSASAGTSHCPPEPIDANSCSQSYQFCSCDLSDESDVLLGTCSGSDWACVVV